MEQIELKTANREILGKKVRFLRRQGITPLHLFGHGIESVALQSETANLRRVLAEAGKTRIVSLKLNNEKIPRNVMVREVQIEPLTGGLLHVDFYQVRMAEKVKVEIPVILLGEAPVLKLKENMLVQELSILTVECLPAKIPASVAVNLSSLTEPEQVVRVKDLELDKEVTALRDPEVVVVRISSRPVEVVEKEREAAAVKAPEAIPSAEEEAKEE
ncbi:MAG: 50S ribosomal protein L25 [Chloroflexi bacterium]|nr:50S ribosomal protein L25 [Chloroflexota bacterium]